MMTAIEGRLINPEPVNWNKILKRTRITKLGSQLSDQPIAETVTAICFVLSRLEQDVILFGDDQIMWMVGWLISSEQYSYCQQKLMLSFCYRAISPWRWRDVNDNVVITDNEKIWQNQSGKLLKWKVNNWTKELT